MMQEIKKKKKSREEVLNNAQKLYNVRNDIINAFENKIFFRQSNINSITKSEIKDFSEQTNISKLKVEQSKNEKKI